MTRRDYLWLAVMLAGMALVWYYFKPQPAPVGQYTQAEKAPQVSGVPTVPLLPKKPIQVYADPAKQRLNLSPEQISNKAIVVVSASRVPSDLHPQTVVTTLDQNTGVFSTLVRSEPYPWLAAEQTGELRLDYGIKNGGLKVARLSLHENLVQIKALHLGVNSSLDTDGIFFVGAGVGWGW